MVQKEMSVPPGTIERLATGLSHAAHERNGRRSSRSSFVPPSLRFGAAFKLRARRSSKSEGGILTMADRPGRFAFLNCKPSTSYWATFIRSLRDDLSRNPFFAFSAFFVAIRPIPIRELVGHDAAEAAASWFGDGTNHTSCDG
jgi:hypothetical protein